MSRPLVLFVCTGNICRSPMAEAFARTAFGETRFRFASAGLAAWDGHPASTEAVAAAKARGVDLRGHRARTLTSAMVEEAAWVVPMTAVQVRDIQNRWPGAAARVVPLGALGRGGAGDDVPDPYGGDPETYRRAAEHIAALLENAHAAWLPGGTAGGRTPRDESS